VSGTALVLAIVFFWVSFRAPDKWSDLALGMATSFVFILLVDGILRARSGLSARRLRDFFGHELADQQLLLTCADFELKPEALGLLLDRGMTVHYQRPHLEGAPQHTQPILFDKSMCLSDIQGLMSVAAALGGRQSEIPLLVQDGEIWKRQGRCSFVSSGLTDSHCTEMYLLADEPPLFSIGSRLGIPTVTLINGILIENNAHREYALIVRFAPARRTVADRRWFLLAGLEEAGSAAAGDFLARQWQDIARHVREGEDFVAIVALDRRGSATVTLEYIRARDEQRTERTAFDPNRWDDVALPEPPAADPRN
jgi:hypothetical protein